MGGYDVYDSSAIDEGYTNYCHIDHGNNDGMILLPACGPWQWGDWPPDDPYAFICEKDLWKITHNEK